MCHPLPLPLINKHFKDFNEKESKQNSSLQDLSELILNVKGWDGEDTAFPRLLGQELLSSNVLSKDTSGLRKMA